MSGLFNYQRDMPVYFIVNNEHNDHSKLQVKVGLSKDVKVRLRKLQTGNPYELRLMGWIETGDHRSLEYDLHKRYAGQRLHGEWFALTPVAVLNEIKFHRLDGYIATQQSAFEIVSFDRDGVPEYVGAWQWLNVEDSDFCPQCGCGCGLQCNENYGTDRCLKCGIIYGYEREP